MSPDSSFKIHRIALSNVSCFLVYRTGSAMLVDCGNRGSERKILSEMEQLGLAPEMLDLLVLTHVHYDHAGSAAKLRALTGCRILLNEKDAPRLAAGRTPFPRGTRWKARIVVGLGRIFAWGILRFPPVEADILSGPETDLAQHGFEGQFYHLPGHTPGSSILLLPGGTLLGGDSFFGLPGKRHFPPFAEDLEALKKSWMRLSDLDFHTIFPAHGQPVSRNEFLEELKAQS